MSIIDTNVIVHMKLDVFQSNNDGPTKKMNYRLTRMTTSISSEALLTFVA